VTPTVVAVPLEITSADGAVLRGVLWPGTTHGVLLLHDDGADLDTLELLSQALAGDGWTVLALDRRGHGASEPEVSAALPELELADAGAALTALRSRDLRTLCLVAVGGAATTGVALRHEPLLAAVALLSPPVTPPDTHPGRPAAAAPALILVGGLDTSSAGTAEALSRRLSGYTAVSRLPTADQGTALLHGPLAGQVVDQVRVFLARHRRW
jgi:pimeloyl-ACP methyl ester carboxylesterase